jgi:hypothetical protein
MALALFVLVPALTPATAAAAERDRTLLLTVAAPAAEAERLEAVTRELLARLSMQVEMRRVERIDVREMRQGLAPAQRYFARVWIALLHSGSARLYLEHGASDRVLVREVTGDTNNPELVREELGHILQTAVEGLKAGEEVGAPRSDALKDVAAEDAAVEGAARETPVQRPTPERAAEPSPTFKEQKRASGPLRFGPRYELSWLGDGRFEDGPGAVFQLALPIGFELSAYYRRPLKVAGDPVGVRLQTLSLRGLLTIQVWSTERNSMRVGAGGGADLVHVSSVAAQAGTLELESASWQKLLLGRLQGSYAYRAFSFMDLEASLGLDLDFNGTRYVFQRTSGELRVLDPLPVRPFLSLGAIVP